MDDELIDDDIDDDSPSREHRDAVSADGPEAIAPVMPPNPLLDFPGSALLDPLLPWVLVVGGTSWVLHDAMASAPRDHTGVGFLRAMVYLAIYSVIAYPITLVAVRAAVRFKRFGLPPAGLFRIFAAFTPPLVFGVVLWLVTGSFGSLIVGLLLGMLMTIGALWLLLRLQVEQAVAVLTAGVVGFLVGTVLAVAILLGINQGLIGSYRLTSHTFKESPLGPGFPWEVPVPLPAGDPQATSPSPSRP